MISPRYIRARQYKYLYTQEGKDWWVREDQGEYLPILTRDYKPLLDVLQSQGIIRAEERDKRDTESLIPVVLDKIRKLTELYPPHIQIWSYAWLAVPMLKPFLIS